HRPASRHAASAWIVPVAETMERSLGAGTRRRPVGSFGAWLILPRRGGPVAVGTTRKGARAQARQSPQLESETRGRRRGFDGCAQGLFAGRRRDAARLQPVREARFAQLPGAAHARRGCRLRPRRGFERRGRFAAQRGVAPE
ncbi:MAG: hypothetical protein ACK56I_34275, partial [bacterium]